MNEAAMEEALALTDAEAAKDCADENAYAEAEPYQDAVCPQYQ
jgi:hypothetical protein